MSTAGTILAFGLLIALAYLMVKLQSRPPRASKKTTRIALGMKKETVQAMLGPPSSVMTGGDIVKGSAVVAGMGSAEAFYGRQLWFYDNTPPRGAITCITISHHGLVEDIDTRTS